MSADINCVSWNEVAPGGRAGVEEVGAGACGQTCLDITPCQKFWVSPHFVPTFSLSTGPAGEGLRGTDAGQSIPHPMRSAKIYFF